MSKTYYVLKETTKEQVTMAYSIFNGKQAMVNSTVKVPHLVVEKAYSLHDAKVRAAKTGGIVLEGIQ